MDLPVDVSWVSVGRGVLAALPLLAFLAGFARGPGALRRRLEMDVDLLVKMPEGTEARKKFENYVSGRVDQFAKVEAEGSRAWQRAIISIVLVIVLMALALWLFTFDHWWWWVLGGVSAVFGLAGVSSMYDDIQRVPRDDDGKRL